jgi:ParB-like chromosome segregation protein Spo0J
VTIQTTAPDATNVEGGNDQVGAGSGSTVPTTSDAHIVGTLSEPFQVMPPLSTEQVAALREDIERRGVLVPIVVDQHARVIDGHNRLTICRRLGIDPPIEVRQVADDEDARQLALTLNLARRHLTRQQVRDLIGRECELRPEVSDRAIARLIGVSPSTVAAVRRPVSNLDTSTVTRAEAEARTEAIRVTLRRAQDELLSAVMQAMSNAITPEEIVTALTTAHRSMVREGRDEHDMIGRYLLGPVIDYVLDPGEQEFWRSQWDHETFLPLSNEERSRILAALAGVGAIGRASS